MANYVKFKRGLAKYFNVEQADSDTLYFIYEEDENSADLYLGSKKISSGEGYDLSNSIQQLKDVVITAVQDKDLLVYDALKGSWVNGSLNDILEDLTIGAIPEIKLITNYLNNSHSDLIEQEFVAVGITPKIGDIIIIRDLIVDGKYSHSSYIFDGVNWCAQCGNHTIDNIYFTEDLLTTESIGSIKPDHGGSAVIPAAGKSVKQVLDYILINEKIPQIEEPTAEIEFIPSKESYEVGDICSLSYKILFNEGNYSYDLSTGVIPSYEIVNLLTGETLYESVGSFSSFTVPDDMQDIISAKIYYTQGNVPHTNLEKEYIEGQIQEGEIKLNIPEFRSFRKAYYGAINNKNDFTSDELKNILNSTSDSLKEQEKVRFELPADTIRVIIAYDASLPDLTQILDENDANTNIISAFETPKLMKFNGASDNTEIDYKVYILNFARETGIKNWFTFVI